MLKILNIILFCTVLVSFNLNAQSENFEKTYLEAIEKARKTEKLCFIFFKTENDARSLWIEQVALSDREILNILNSNYISVSMHEKDFESSSIMRQNNLKNTPSFLILNLKSEMIASLDHGLTQKKLKEWLQFYSEPVNALKSMNFDDPHFENEVSNWAKIYEKSKIDIPPTHQESTITTEKIGIDENQNVPEITLVKELKTDEKMSPKTDEGNFVLQVGVFGTEVNALSLQKKIAEKIGISPYIEFINLNNKPLYKVLCGKFISAEEAQKIQIKLESLGFKALLKQI